MDREDREKMEKNDMELLHAYFEKGSISGTGDLEYPELKPAGWYDPWTDLNNVLSRPGEPDASRVEEIFGNLTREGNDSKAKKAWLLMLGCMALNDTVNILRVIEGTSEHMPDQISDESVRATAAILAKHWKDIKDEELREEKRAELNELLRRMNVANFRERELQESEADYQRHVQPSYRDRRRR